MSSNHNCDKNHHNLLTNSKLLGIWLKTVAAADRLLVLTLQST